MCVAGRYPERTSNFDTLHVCTQQLTLSLSPFSHRESRVRRSKLINHRKSITRRDEGVSFASERHRRKSLMSYATDTHIDEWSMKSSFLAFFFCLCLHTSIRCETVKMVRDEESHPDHYYARACAQLIIDLAVVEKEKKKKKEKRRIHARKQSAFSSSMFARSVAPSFVRSFVRSDGND